MRQVADPAGVAPPGRRGAGSAPRVVASVGCVPRGAPLPLSWLVGLGVLACLAVFGLGLLASAGADQVPATTAVVRVQPGESLWDVAERTAPDSDTAAVVDHIRELNGLTGASVRPGQPLTVPHPG